MLLSFSLSPALAIAQEPKPQSIEIPAQPLTDALVQLGSAYGAVIIASDSLVNDKTSAATIGTLTIEEALSSMLQSTGLVASKNATGGWVIQALPANAVPLPSASNPAGQIEEVFVTALKRKTRLEDAPLSLTVFDSDEIQRSNFVNFEDIALRTPNVSFQNNGGPSRTLFTIRGVGGGNVGSGTGTSVGIYVDEIILNPTGSLRQNDLALLDLERVEVLRGPQGTLFGRNTIGGAINYVSRKPHDTFSARVTAGVERFDTHAVEGHINIPISDRVFLQASALDRETGGFIENTTTGNDLGSGGRGGRLALRLMPIDELTIDIAAMQNEVFYDNLQGISEPDFDNGDYEVASLLDVENSVDSELYSMRIEYNAPAFDVISITAYNEFEADETLDLGGGLFASFGASISTSENISQELRIQSNNPTAALRWLIGANYAETDDTGSFLAALGTPSDPIRELLRDESSGQAENTAVFASVEFGFLTGTTLTLGGRYSWDDYELVTNNGDRFPGSSDEFTPSFTLSHDLGGNALLYASVAKGYRPGGADRAFTDLNPQDGITSEYGPETAWNYEFGANVTLWDGKFAGRASVFFMEYEDIQSVFFLPPANLQTLTANGAAAEIYGTELEASITPIDGLTFNLNLGLLESEFTDFADSPEGDITGNELPFAPAVNFSATGEYRWQLPSSIDAYLRAEYTYRSDQEGRNDNNPTERQPGYELFNLRAGLASDRYQLELYGENVLDEEYFTNRRPGPVVSVVPGRPAIWGVRATARF
ncbi:MAG: TonB-dependent receptor [Pseudomonadota bacterium]